MIANQQEKNNAMEAIRLLEQSISIFDTPGARLAKAHIFHSLKQNETALQELSYIIANFQDDDTYLPARQLKDEIENPPKKGMCFVATAAYGSPFAPEVEIFRQFRDETLLKSKIGEKFVEFYYRFSPPIATVISRWSYLRAFTRIVFLSPILKILKTKKAKTVKNINILILLFLFVYLISCSSIYAQKQKRASSKPPAASPQPKQSSPITKTETQDEQKPLTNANIIQMVKAGFGESVILNAIQTNETQFDVSMSALFELKSAGVSQKIIEAMQSTVGKRQNQVSNSTSPIPRENSQSSSSKTTNSNLISDTQGLPVYGTVSDIKDFNRIYISVENAQSRDRIIKALGKAPQFQIVKDPQDAQIFLEYKILSRDNNSDTSDTDLRIKSQMNAVVIKNNKRVIAWSDTVDHVRKTLGGIGWRSTHNEIKLTERFLKALKE
jgi:uncharacterized protein with PQ loop repeat